MQSKKRILFVCLGNICRSPAAEGIFKEILNQHNLNDKYFIDSAGTSAHHAGEGADSRMIDEGRLRGFNLDSISRQFITSDFSNFDHIIVMDSQNQKRVLELASSDEERAKVTKMSLYCSSDFSRYDEVPDPYFGGPSGFKEVYDLLEDACSGLLKSFK